MANNDSEKFVQYYMWSMQFLRMADINGYGKISEDEFILVMSKPLSLSYSVYTEYRIFDNKMV